MHSMVPCILDVRTPEEFNQGAAPQSINIPLGDLESRLHELNPHQPFLLCCASGIRSEIAVKILKDHGFQKVINIGSWKTAELTLATSI